MLNMVDQIMRNVELQYQWSEPEWLEPETREPEYREQYREPAFNQLVSPQVDLEEIVAIHPEATVPQIAPEVNVEHEPHYAAHAFEIENVEMFRQPEFVIAPELHMEPAATWQIAHTDLMPAEVQQFRPTEIKPVEVKASEIAPVEREPVEIEPLEIEQAEIEQEIEKADLENADIEPAAMAQSQPVAVKESPAPQPPGFMSSLAAWLRNQFLARQSKKRLRVCETVSLGEKRFVAVIQVDGEQFLVGGAAGSVATLARLEPQQEFSDILKRRWTESAVQA